MSGEFQPDVPSTLCHPDASKSCGACCGMYNYIEHDSDTVESSLRRRTRAFRRDVDPSDPESLTTFRRTWEPVSGKLLDDLPNCPFLGFVNGGRVGCMAHPLQNDGVDGRDCGVYDRHTCEDYLCAAHRVLRPIEKWLVIETMDSSFAYGLVITDPLFVRQLFERAADLAGASPRPARVMRPESVEAARAYFALKTDWPFGAVDAVFGQVASGEGFDTPRRAEPTDGLDTPSGPYDAILRCLGTEVETVRELEKARELVELRVRRFAEAVGS